MKGNYIFKNVRKSHANRLQSLNNELWSEALAFRINHEQDKACQELQKMLRQHARTARRIKRSLSAIIGNRKLTDVGVGLARRIATAMATIRRPEVLNPAMYPLTLPRSGVTVVLSPKALTYTTNVGIDYALILAICDWLDAPSTSDCTPTNGVTRLPAGLQVEGYFRHHDSGDLQSVAHLAKICEVARLTPRVRHWLPTRELAFLKAYVAGGGIVPRNLVIRVSATMIDGPATRAWPTTSGVYTVKPPKHARRCVAPDHDNTCGPCRACWDPRVKHIVYHKH